MANFNRVLITRYVRFALVLTLIVIMLGAWTRLRDAGLGCPDWPTCYGHLSVPSSAASLARAQSLYPGVTVQPEKAWPETIHRYFASSIGLVIALLAAWLWTRRREPGMPWRHGLGLLALVCLQGAFGALTVTHKLYPPVVTGHLLLGFSTLSVLFLLYLRLANAFVGSANVTMLTFERWLWLVIVLLIVQISLGGWTASNYAASMCTQLPICEPGWQQAWVPSEAFRVFRPDDRSYEYAPHLDAAAKISIHVAHRLGAMVVTLSVLILALCLYLRANQARYRRFAIIIGATLLLQVALGMVNVLAHLPLFNAVAHNLCAAILLQVLLALAFALRREHS